MDKEQVIQLIRGHFSPAEIKASILIEGSFTDTIERHGRTIVVHIERNDEEPVRVDVTLSFSRSRNDVAYTLFAAELGFEWANDGE